MAGTRHSSLNILLGMNSAVLALNACTSSAPIGGVIGAVVERLIVPSNPACHPATGRSTNALTNPTLPCLVGNI